MTRWQTLGWIALWLAGCDSPLRQGTPDGSDVVGNDLVEIVDVPDPVELDVPGWPPRENCLPTPTHGLPVGVHDFFFSVPYTTQGVLLSLTEDDGLLMDRGKYCDFIQGVNVWQQEISRYDLNLRSEEELVAYPSSQSHPNEYDGRIFYASLYAPFQPDIDFNSTLQNHPWKGKPNIWVWEAGQTREYTTWCPRDAGCTFPMISKNGKMVYQQYFLTLDPYFYENTLVYHDLNTLETREFWTFHDSPLTIAVGDRAIFWTYAPCGNFRYYDIERDEVVTNENFNVFAAIAWRKYIAWGNCFPYQMMVLNLETGELRRIDQELDLDPDNHTYAIHTAYEHLVAAVDKRREIANPGVESHLWLYDLDTRVERRITSESAKWTWGSHRILNCRWAILTLDYGKASTTIFHYPKAALNLVEAGIVDEDCHLIPGPPLEFTLEDFLLATGFSLEGYDPNPN